MEVYQRPATRFVATFVGSPAMNILPITVSGPAIALDARLSDGSLVEDAGAPADKDWRELGVRPEALIVVPDGGELSATANVVERLGERTLVACETGGWVADSRAGSGAVERRAGGTIRLKVDTAALHLFTADGFGLARGVTPLPDGTSSSRRQNFLTRNSNP